MIEAYPNGKEKGGPKYEYKTGSITVAGVTGTTDLSGITGFTTLFSTVNRAYRIQIFSTAAVYVRLNSATNDLITIDATNPLPEVLHQTEVKKIFISTGGAAVTVTVIIK